MPRDAVSVADLFRELQETNRLLRALASQKGITQATVEEPRLPLVPTRGTPSSQALSDTGTVSPPTPELGTLRETARQFVDGLAHAVFGSRNREHLDGFRDQTLRLITRAPEPTRGRDTINPRHQVNLKAQLIGSHEARTGPVGKPAELLWNWRTSTVERNLSLRPYEVDQLQRQWPVQFDLDRLTQTISRDSGWILGKDARRDGALCAFPLLHGPDSKLIPAHTVLDVSQKDTPAAARLSGLDVTSPGSFW
jgi:hypothetical protein